MLVVLRGVDSVRRWNGMEKKSGNISKVMKRKLRPKRVIMTNAKFMELGHVVFLDSDARIVDEKFAKKIPYYNHFAVHMK